MPVIRSFRHPGVEKFYRTGSKAGIQPKHAKRLKVQLAQLDVAVGPNDMAVPIWRLHPLKGGPRGSLVRLGGRELAPHVQV